MKSTHGSLDGVWAKIGRAKHHYDILEEYISDTFSVDASKPTIGVRLDAQGRYHVLYVSEMPNLGNFTTIAATIVGDLVHNLRASLDHLVYQLAVKRTKGNVKRPRVTAFPICDTRAGFLRERSRRLREVRGDWTRIERLQPYPRRNREPHRSLARLRDLDDRDKHRLLVPTLMTPRGVDINLDHPAARAVAFAISGEHRRFKPYVPIELGTELLRIRATPETRGEVEAAGHLHPEIAIGEREPALRTLARLWREITLTVGAFDDSF